jgi:hypothetical protein
MASILRPFVGNTRLFSNSLALKMEQSVPGFSTVNDGMVSRNGSCHMPRDLRTIHFAVAVTKMAPAWKWGVLRTKPKSLCVVCSGMFID